MASADNDNMPGKDGSTGAAPEAGPKCPICGKPSLRAIRPFCSARCADIDLGRWMAGSYLIVGGEADADEDGDAAVAIDAGRQRPDSGPDRETE